jgi:hypothetical protein
MTHDGHEPPERKNPPRISAGGFQAKQFTLKKSTMVHWTSQPKFEFLFDSHHAEEIGGDRLCR